MKLQINGKEIYELLPWQQEVIKNDLLSENFEEDMERRARYIWEHKFDQCFAHLQNEWLEILRKDPAVTSIPTDKKAFAEMIFARPDYKNRSQREAEKRKAQELSNR